MKTTFLQPPIDIQLVCNRLEIGFWRLTIDLLSDSRLLQKLVAGVCDFTWRVRRSVQVLDRRRAVLWAAAGLSLGFLAAIAGAMFIF